MSRDVTVDDEELRNMEREIFDLQSENMNLKKRITTLEQLVKEAVPIMYTHGLWKGVSTPSPSTKGGLR